MAKNPNFENVPVMWKPNENSGQQMKKFMKHIEKKYKVKLSDFWDMHKWSTDNIPEFWHEMWHYYGVICSKPYDEVVDMTLPMEDTVEWFKGARMNFAENVLKYKDDNLAIVAIGEDRDSARYSYAQMNNEVKLYAAALRKLDIQKGDRVIGYMSNREEVVFAMIASASVGAIWSGALPLMGAQAVLNRFKQIQPKILFAIDRFLHNGQEIDMLPKLEEISKELLSLEKTVIVPSKSNSKQKDISRIRGSCFLDEFLQLGRNEDGTVPDIIFEQVPFSHPVTISFTSGTTGLPKALVHHSGILLTIARDYSLHSDNDRNQVILSMSPVGWASWNMVLAMHFLGFAIVMFEGFPFFLRATYLWDMVDELKLTKLFLTPNTMDELEKRKYLPTEKHDLKSLRTIIGGSSVVKPSNYDFIYKELKAEVVFSSAYFSTETMGAILMLEQSLPVYRGEANAPCLGTAYACLNESGESVEGEIGDFVITKPSLSLPVEVWGDADRNVYKNLYFKKHHGKFCLGDLAMINPVTKGVIVCGRGDDTLKPKGCRFGSSEIYNIVNLLPEVADSLCVSQYNKERDERAVLFVKVNEGSKFSQSLVLKIRESVATELSVSHVPEVILETKDIPYNMNGKKMELIVKKIINNMNYNADTIVNPECLENFKGVPELQEY